MKPESYREQDSCRNCKHVFVLCEYDQSLEYFCHVDKSDRPRCGSVLKKEGWGSDDVSKSEEERDKIYSDDWDRWDEWSEPRDVQPNGVCDKYERR